MPRKILHIVIIYFWHPKGFRHLISLTKGIAGNWELFLNYECEIERRWDWGWGDMEARLLG